MAFRRSHFKSQREAPVELADARVRELALGRLSRSELSEKALFDYLKRKGASEKQAAQEVARLVDLGLVSDLRVARAWVRAYLTRGKSGHVIRQSLGLKGVKLNDIAWQELYEEILREVAQQGPSVLGVGAEDSEWNATDIKGAERERALQVLNRKYGRYQEDPKIARRAFGALVRRGFSVSIVKDLIPTRLLR
jgi:SOS response regulatory protein OraA/RecX